MEWHIKCDAKDIHRYVFCPGDQARAKKIAEHFDNHRLVTERPRLRGVFRASIRACP
jgi:Uridine phosphorylase